MEDLGQPIAYLVLSDGTPVYDIDGLRVGEVVHVLADEEVDIFHGLIVRTADGPDRGDRHMFARREQIRDLFERGVVLSVRGGDLPEPSEDAAARAADSRSSDGPLPEGLRRAWHWLSRR